MLFSKFVRRISEELLKRKPHSESDSIQLSEIHKTAECENEISVFVVLFRKSDFLI
jgi:hypothetical protein